MKEIVSAVVGFTNIVSGSETPGWSTLLNHLACLNCSHVFESPYDILNL